MIHHLDEGSLQALLDDELSASEVQPTREHLASCPTCRTRLAEARDANHVLASALALLEPSVAGVKVRSAAAPPWMRRSRAPRRWGMARAAAMLLVFAAAASATLPGSPLRDWLAATSDSFRDPAGPAATASTGAATAPADPPVETGVSVQLTNGRFEVLLRDPDPDLLVRARLVGGPRGAVYAIGEAGEARFGTAPGSIEVTGAGAGELRVEIPRAATAATLSVDGRILLVKDGDQLRRVSTEDAESGEVLFRVRE